MSKTPYAILSSILVITFVCGCRRGDPPVTVREFRKELPASVRWEPVSYPAEQDGWPLAVKATELTLPQKTTEAIGTPSVLSNMEELYTHASKGVTPEIQARAEPLMKAYGPAFDQIVEAAKRPHWVIPPLPDNEVPDIKVENVRPVLDQKLYRLKNISKALIIRAEVRLSQGDHAKALDDLLLVNSIGHHLIGAHFKLMYHLMGVSICDLADRAIQQSVITAKWSAADIKRLMGGIEEGKPGEDLIACMRYEFDTEFVRYIAGMPDPKNYLFMPEDAEAQKAIKRLLAKHKKPFDRRETVKQASELFGKVLENIQRPWNSQENLFKLANDVMASVPPTFRKIYDTGMAPESLSDSEASKIQDTLNKVSNPIGRLLIVRLLPTYGFTDKSERRSTANTRVTRIILAMELYRLEKKQEPATLKALVDAGYLASVPLDPFSDKPFPYAANRHLIWSYGINGKDDGGLDPKGHLNLEDADFTWPTDGVF